MSAENENISKATIIYQQNKTYAQNLGRIDFQENEFDKAIIQHGAKVLWQRAILCPCLDETTGQPNYMCPSCRGKGFIYDDGTEIKALAYSQRGQKDDIDIGLLDVGTSLMTTRAQDRVGFRDRLTFLDMKTPFSEVRTFHFDEYNENADEEKDIGALLKYDCLELIRVISTSNSLGICADITNYTIVNPDNPKRLIFEDGIIEDGDRFSVLSLIQPVYIVIDIPHELRGAYIKFKKPVDTWCELPKQFMIKREDLIPLTRGELL